MRGWDVVGADSYPGLGQSFGGAAWPAAMRFGTTIRHASSTIWWMNACELGPGAGMKSAMHLHLDGNIPGTA
jgi:hypothetical protein